MQIEKIEFDQVSYNPERAGFEALVNIRDKETTYSYAVHVAAPLHAEYALVTRKLAQSAERMHRGTRPGLRTARPTETLSYQARVEQILAANAIWKDDQQWPLAA